MVSVPATKLGTQVSCALREVCSHAHGPRDGPRRRTPPTDANLSHKTNKNAKYFRLQSKDSQKLSLTLSELQNKYLHTPHPLPLM